MNAQPQILPLPAETESASAPRPHADATPDASPSTIPSSLKKRRTSKIARLPKKLRDLINDRLSDGVPYDQIALELQQSTDPPLPCEISARNISDWFAGGYQDWLRHQDSMDLLAARFDSALDLAQNSQPDKLQELSLQLAAIRLCEFLSELAITDAKTDPAIYLRLLSTLPRISKEALNLQKYRDAALQGQAAKTAPPANDAARAEAVRAALMDKMDDIMGLTSYRHKPALPAPPPPAGQPSLPTVPESSAEPAQASTAPHPSESDSCDPSDSAALDQKPATETYGNPQKPNPASEPAAPNSNQEPKLQIADPMPAPLATMPEGNTAPAPHQSKIEDQNAKMKECCLECHTPLPPLLPSGARPAKRCGYCNFLLPLPGSCRQPSIEQCEQCTANLPRLLPNGERPDIYCHNCESSICRPKPIPDADPSASFSPVPLEVPWLSRLRNSGACVCF